MPVSAEHAELWLTAGEKPPSAVFLSAASPITTVGTSEPAAARLQEARDKGVKLPAGGYWANWHYPGGEGPTWRMTIGVGATTAMLATEEGSHVVMVWNASKGRYDLYDFPRKKDDMPAGWVRFTKVTAGGHTRYEFEGRWDPPMGARWTATARSY